MDEVEEALGGEPASEEAGESPVGLREWTHLVVFSACIVGPSIVALLVAFASGNRWLFPLVLTGEAVALYLAGSLVGRWRITGRVKFDDDSRRLTYAEVFAASSMLGVGASVPVIAVSVIVVALM